MKKQLSELIQLGKIPDDDENLSDELFQKYDSLISNFPLPLTWEEGKSLIMLFADDNLDLNWGLLHLIENLPFRNPLEIEKYKVLISKCPNTEFREIMEIRLTNWLTQ